MISDATTIAVNEVIISYENVLVNKKKLDMIYEIKNLRRRKN